MGIEVEQWLHRPMRSTPDEFGSHRKRAWSAPLTDTLGVTLAPRVEGGEPEVIAPDVAGFQEELEALRKDTEKFRLRGNYVRLFMPEAKGALLPLIDPAADWGLQRIALKRALAQAEEAEQAPSENAEQADAIKAKKAELTKAIAKHEQEDPFPRAMLEKYIDLVKKELPAEIEKSLADLKEKTETEINKVKKEAERVGGRDAQRDAERFEKKARKEYDHRDRFARQEQFKNFEEECKKIYEVLGEAESNRFVHGNLGGVDFDKKLKPNLSAGESQLVWSALLTYMHAHGHLANDARLQKLDATHHLEGSQLRAYRMGFETHPLVEKIAEDKMLDGMKNACCKAARGFISGNEADAIQAYFGAPGSNFYCNLTEKFINLDLPKTLAFGASPVLDMGDKQWRFRALVEPIIIHEVAHALYSDRYPKQMQDIRNTLKELGPKGGMIVEERGMYPDERSGADGFERDDYIKFEALYKEWQMLHQLWNALEDHAMNQHAVRLRIEEDRAERYPIDTPRLLQLAYGLFRDVEGTLADYHLHNRSEAVEEALPAGAAELANARFAALTNAALYSYYVDTLHMLPPGDAALRAMGVPKGALDAAEAGYTEADIMKKLTEASQTLQLDGLPAWQDEAPMAVKNRPREKRGATFEEHQKAIIELMNDRRNEAIQSIFDIANEIALPTLREEWRKQAGKAYDAMMAGKAARGEGGKGVRIKNLPPGESPHGSPKDGRNGARPGGKGTSVNAGSKEYTDHGQELSDIPQEKASSRSESEQESPTKNRVSSPAPYVNPGDPVSAIGRKALDNLKASGVYSTYAQADWYQEAVLEVAEELKRAVATHTQNISDFASKYPGRYEEIRSNIPDPNRISKKDMLRHAERQEWEDAGRFNSEDAGVFERKNPDILSPMTHHMVMLVDGTPSMGGRGDEEENEQHESRQKIAAKLATLMHDAVGVVNKFYHDNGLNEGVPPLTSTIIEWGDEHPLPIVSSAMENSPMWGNDPETRQAVRNTCLSKLTEGKGCGGTIFAPAPAAGFEHLCSDEMLAFQNGPGPAEPTVATVNTIIISDGGISPAEKEKVTNVIAAMRHHDNAGADLLLLGKDSDALSEALNDAYDSDKMGSAAMRGRPPTIQEYPDGQELQYADALLSIINNGITSAPNVLPLNLERHAQSLETAIAEMYEHSGQERADTGSNPHSFSQRFTDRGVPYAGR